jgi:hypothetical protein
MYIIRYVTDKGTRQSEPVPTLESARYLRAEILGHYKPHETEIVSLSDEQDQTPTTDLLRSILADDD